jgi:hypothetical protein
MPAANRLKLLSAQVEHPTEAVRAARGVHARLAVTVEVENQDTAPLFVWASPRGYDYDAQSKVLTLHLSEQPPAARPGIIIISQHPRAPAQVEVAPGSRAQVKVEIPPVTRSAAPDGQGWVEHPIGEVTRVDVDVQHAPAPFKPTEEHEDAEAFRARMLQHGQVVQARLRPSSGGDATRRKE